MDTRNLLLGGVVAIALAGCFNPTKPEIDTADPSLPFDKAMGVVIKKDKFLANNLRPGFDHAANGSWESYLVSADETGAPTLDHLAMLSAKWCNQNGGKLVPAREITVLQRGVGIVLQQRENLPVVGRAYNMICYRNRQAIAAAAIGRENYFLNTDQFRQAMRDAGAAITEPMPRD